MKIFKNVFERFQNLRNRSKKGILKKNWGGFEGERSKDTEKVKAVNCVSRQHED